MLFKTFSSQVGDFKEDKVRLIVQLDIESKYLEKMTDAKLSKLQDIINDDLDALHETLLEVLS